MTDLQYAHFSLTWLPAVEALRQRLIHLRRSRAQFVERHSRLEDSQRAEVGGQLASDIARILNRAVRVEKLAIYPSLTFPRDVGSRLTHTAIALRELCRGACDTMSRCERLDDAGPFLDEQSDTEIHRFIVRTSGVQRLRLEIEAKLAMRDFNRLPVVTAPEAPQAVTEQRPVHRSERPPVPADGPDLVDGVVRWQGKCHKLAPKPMRLLVVLWTDPELLAETAYERAWQHIEDARGLNSVFNDINRALRAVGHPFRISRKNGYALFREKPSA